VTVQERPVIDLLTFQVWDGDASAWTDLADKATSIDIRRGAQQSGASVETQVGTLEANLYGPLDLARLSDLQPNSPIRVIRPPLPPAQVWDLTPTDAADYKASKALWPLVRIPATVTATGADTTAIGAGTADPTYQRVSAGYSANGAPSTIAAGTILAASPNTAEGIVPTNPKPVGKFYPGDPYTLRATFRSQTHSGDERTGPLRIVLYTGPTASPAILATSAAFTPAPADAEIVWTFTAPTTDDWNVAIVNAVDTATPDSGPAIMFRLSGVTITDHGTPRPEFTGAISDIYQNVEYDKGSNEKHTFTTVQAVDAVQSLANTDRYGVIARSGSGYQSWADRIQQLSESAHVPIDAPVLTDVTIFDQKAFDARYGVKACGFRTDGGTLAKPDGWEWGGRYAEWTVETLGFDWAPAQPTSLTGVRVYQASIRNMTPGQGHAVVITATFENTGVTGAAFSVGYQRDDGQMVFGDAFDPTVTTPQTLRLQFVPTSAVGNVGVYQRGTAQLPNDKARLHVEVSDTRVIRSGTESTYALQDVAYESTLLNHFDLACNSVGARWYVTKRGAVLFRQQDEDTEPGARFTDSAAGDVSYTDVALAYDTRNVVNSLKLNQHGYDPATGNANDVSVTFTEDPSIEKWGARAAELDTCLYLGAPHTNDAAQRASEVMGTLRRPRYTVQSFTINAQSDVEILDALELRATVAVDYEGIRQRSRVLALTHAITPTQWMVTVDLNESATGPTFAAFTAARSGTFADLATATPGQTFRDFNATPLQETTP
jgi:hypothetical protein